MGYLLDRFVEMKSDQGKTIWKHAFYAPIYEEWLNKYVGTEAVLLELGVGKGGSPQVWQSYLGEKAQVIGLDCDPALFYEDPKVKFLVANQYDRESLKACPVKDFDVFIDDGSHLSSATIATFEEMFPRLKNGGLYIIEDVGTSYRKCDFGGGFRKQGTLIEYFKDAIDILQSNEWGTALPKEVNMRETMAAYLPIENYDLLSNISAVTIYTGMIIVKKK